MYVNKTTRINYVFDIHQCHLQRDMRDFTNSFK